MEVSPNGQFRVSMACSLMNSNQPGDTQMGPGKEFGNMKINVDRSKGDPGMAAVGGLASDANGKWLLGFQVRVGWATTLASALWGVWKAVAIAAEQEYPRIIIEPESHKITNLTGSIE
ncbi:hypothetical protein Acr_02g0009170 [Actinidia rufa]|uniref:RNase H type-1 domain-containing protein n=1 Tax=Actinidia rufa TaxID=165716 RepID=A0A7J0EAK3_9ERIC|nr:hypothetical protein Acr_02g0009170 [Actinidia rufa]